MRSLLGQFKSALLVPALLLAPFALAAQEAGLFYSRDVPQIEFAASEIRAASQAKGIKCVVLKLAELPKALQPIRIVLASSETEARELAALGASQLRTNATAESYIISKKFEGLQTTYFVIGADPIGAMYGGLDIAEALRLGTMDQLKTGEHAPFVARRGIKFNLPLDARTPSYSDAGDAAQQNIPEMWSMDFWREFLDQLARDRFDVLSLWNLHPFPSLVKVPEYPDVALNDVMRTTEKFDTSFNLTGKDMVRPAMLAHLETVKKMSIDEKIKFWRDVMQYAHDRGIDVYLFTWNIFVFGTDGKHGITPAQDNLTTIDYFRKSVAQTLVTYPLLKGIGITGGEHMQKLPGDFTNEKWLWKTYGEGIRDVKKLQPNRSIPLIHRIHQTSINEIKKEWANYPDTFEFSFKYSVAHMYSLTNPPFAGPTLDALPAGQRTWLTVRNDDIYSFRWGDPTFARDYIRNMPGPDKLAGFYMGPDGYIWGREFISTEPDSPRQLVIKKQGYSFMLWGRLGYDPALPDSLFEKTLAAQFPKVDATKLFAAYCAASRVIPQINRFFWAGGGNDLGWFPEACVRHPAGSKDFYTVMDFMKGKTMPGAGILDISTYCDKTIRQEAVVGITPLQVAEALKADADTALELLAKMPEAKEKELRLTLGDLTAMAHLGNYYAEKILGATDLALFKKTGKPELQTSAIAHLEKALAHWKKYSAVATAQYHPQLLTRIGYVDLNALTESVQRDLAIVKEMKAQ
jgi:hypothetical protein